jgi:hypothetical protein
VFACSRHRAAADAPLLQELEDAEKLLARGR